MLLWTLIRLPETLRPGYRRPLDPKTIWDGAWQTLSNRQSLGYTLAFTLMMASLMGYINSIQQIVFDIFRRPELIAATFAGVALPMAFTSWLNSRIVERIGTRRVAHTGLALFTGSALAHLAIVLTVGESLWLFIALQGLTMACFGLASANFGALAMQPLGHVAGTASSVQGTIGTIGGALLGLLVGQSFDGTLVPMVGSFAAFRAIGLLILLVTERGLFGQG